MPTSYRAPMFASVSGHYVLKYDCPSLRVLTIDGKPYDILPPRIVKRVNWMDNESVIKRLWRRITGKVAILLPAPDTRFAIIPADEFERCFTQI